jgi:type II secretory pathway pseudopilin PulG
VEGVITVRLRRLHQAQSGLSAVEMIITMALTGIVLGAIFSVYLLLYRVQTTFEDKSQARALGLVAEQRLQEDLQRYVVMNTNPLVLSAATTTSPTFFVTYDLDSQSRLTRQVSGEPTPTIVAHGIKSFTQTCNDTPSTAITVLMQVDGLGGGAVSVSPPLTVTLRNQLGCP